MTLHKRFTWIVGMCLVVLLTDSEGISEISQKRFSTLEGNLVHLQPSGGTFEVPADWTTGLGSVRLTRPQIDDVKNGKQEWDREYAKVLNAALPFVDCSFQGGSHQWDSPTFKGIQARGYVLDSNLETTEERISAKALKEARSVASKNSTPALSQEMSGSWHRIRISFDVSFGDYGGKANVDFYIAGKKNRSVVLVFMYAGSKADSDQITQILKSFSWAE